MREPIAESGLGVMSALPPKADMCGAKGNVCFVPKADILNQGAFPPSMEKTRPPNPSRPLPLRATKARTCKGFDVAMLGLQGPAGMSPQRRPGTRSCRSRCFSGGFRERILVHQIADCPA